MQQVQRWYGLGQRTGFHGCTGGHRRRGKVLVFLVILLPTLLGVLGLVIDGSRLMTEAGFVQHAADAAAISAAAALAQGEDALTAELRAIESVHSHHGLGNAHVVVDIPPTSGPYAGMESFASVEITRPIPSLFMPAVNGVQQKSVRNVAVAGGEDSTAGAAIVVLDPSPPGIDMPTVLGLSLPTLPSLHLGGLEVLGLGQLEVQGAVLVNTEWGGVDENGDPAGEAGFLRSAVTATPLLPLTKLKASDIRVVGGVDNELNYGPLNSGAESPLRANMLPVPDPLLEIPAPTTAADPVNVKSNLRGGVVVVGIPLIGPEMVLQPGVYDYIQIVTGRVRFQKGVYIIRGKNPLTNIPLQIIGGEINADGVMFYITNSTSYSAVSGSPDAADGDQSPGNPTLGTVLPSVVINAGLLGSKFKPLNSPGSPFHGLLFYQRRADRRVMVIVRDTLLANSEFSGTLYAKWGHVVLVGMGTFDSRFVVGSLRIVNVLGCQIEPTTLLPPAQDVYLVQ